MTTTLEQQSKRAEDPRFLAQVRAAIIADARDMLRKSGSWEVTEEQTKRGEDASARSFAMRIIEDPFGVAAKCARVIVSDPRIVEVDLKGTGADIDCTVDDDVLVTAMRRALRVIVGRAD